MMKQITYIIWQENEYFVARCLNFEVSSFGENFEEAQKNLKEAIELYLEGESEIDFQQVGNIFLGKETISA